MNQGLWVWPSEPRRQQRVLEKVLRSEHLMAALKAIAKSKDGLSNAEVDDLIADNSNWMTLWVLRQLLSLGFIEYKVDLFGGPGKYTLTPLGKEVVEKLTGQPVAPKPAPQTAPPPPRPQASPSPPTVSVPPPQPKPAQS